MSPLKMLLTFLTMDLFVCFERKTHLVIDFQSEIGRIPRPFWQSTGFSPYTPHPEMYLQSRDLKLNLALIAALPRNSIKYVRVHWLLDLITVSDGFYNFTHLDNFLDYLHEYRLVPIFELMGNPSGIFSNFTNLTQVHIYEDLIRKLHNRYQIRYGKRLEKWLFETWNEPDLKEYNILNMTIQGYLNYVQASRNGVISSKLGGPAGLFKDPDKHTLCWGMLNFCKENKCPYDFITFHAKGNGSSQGIMNRTLDLIDEIKANHSKILKLPIANDEADPLTGWWLSAEWRADTNYAAMVARTVIEYQNTIVNKLRLEILLLSNDNAFINYHPYYFTQRTLLARFQINNTQVPYIDFIKKPVYVIMGLLSFLGTRQFKVDQVTDPDRSVIATICTENGIIASILLVRSNETAETGPMSANITLQVQNLPKSPRFKFVIYLLDNNATNPYEIWKRNGAPVFPNLTVFQLMREVEGPNIYQGISLWKGQDINVNMLKPSIMVVRFCSEGRRPDQVFGLQVLNITWNQVLIIWKDRSRCVWSYDIEFSHESSRDGFQKINNNTVFNSFNYQGSCADTQESTTESRWGSKRSCKDGNFIEFTTGWYRVRGNDYWNQQGPFSKKVAPPKMFTYPYELPTREEQIKTLGDDFDVIIIGGGASGAGCALDAVTRGLKTVLIEMDDFASGTSSKSTQLIHGGVRYLQKAVMSLDREQFNMVREALHERTHMLTVAPHLTRPLPILLPVYTWWKIPYFYAGMKMYDSIAGHENLDSSHVLGKRKTHEYFPYLCMKDLAGSIVYCDGQQDDARMNLAIALTACRYGATVLNHLKATGLLRDENGKLNGVEIEDQLTKEACYIKGKCIINCAGPMTDYIRMMDDPTAKKICMPSSGTHVVLPDWYCNRKIGLLDSETSDDRVVFMLPWHNKTVAGTTDHPCELTHHPAPTEKEIQYILGEIRKFFNDDFQVRRSDVLGAFCGIRPLVADPKAKNTQSLVRNHLVNISDSGLVTLAGGKWTTYRKMAEDAVDAAVISACLQPRVPSSQTSMMLLEGAHGWTPHLYIKLIQEFDLTYHVARHLANIYGAKAILLLHCAKKLPGGMNSIHPHFPHIQGEIHYGLKTYAYTATDMIGRRLRLTNLDAKAAQESVPLIVDIMAKKLNWSDEVKRNQIEEVTNFIQHDMGGSLIRDLKRDDSHMDIKC